jgi:hypothetical protein
MPAGPLTIASSCRRSASLASACSVVISADAVLAFSAAARAGNRRFGLVSALRAHTKAQYKPDVLWRTRRALDRPGRARTILGHRRARHRVGLQLLGRRDLSKQRLLACAPARYRGGTAILVGVGDNP